MYRISLYFISTDTTSGVDEAFNHIRRHNENRAGLLPVRYSATLDPRGDGACVGWTLPTADTAAALSILQDALTLVTFSSLSLAAVGAR